MVAAVAFPPAPPRTFRVFHGERLLGFLGEGSGSFESSAGASEPGPPSCRYRSVAQDAETTLLELLHATDDFRVVLEVLERAGLTLEETSELAFRPSSIIFRTIVPSSIVES
ncbi:MAG: hypothetical protein AAFZ18_09605 [Myxococcota bacterium]